MLSWPRLLTAVTTGVPAAVAVPLVGAEIDKDHCRTDLPPNPSSGAEVDYQRSFHLSVALCGSLLLLFLQRRTRRDGYTLSSHWIRSTDDRMWILMGIISIVWTALIPVSAKLWDDCDPTHRIQDSHAWGGNNFWGRLAFSPWILDGVFCWWVSRRILFFCAGSKRTPWEGVLAFAVTAIPTTWAAVGAIEAGLYTLGMLTFACLIMFLFIMFTSFQETNHGYDLHHRYAMDDIRVPLLSVSDTGMVYVLPYLETGWMSRISLKPCSGFRPVFSYCLKEEQQLLERHKHFFDPMDRTEWNLSACRSSVHTIVMDLIKNINNNQKMINQLGYWLYWHPELPRNAARLPTKEGKVRNGFSLIGRDIAFALLVWEHLVFERRWQLDSKLRGQVWLLRKQKYTGAGFEDPENEDILDTKGSPENFGGFNGLLEAIGEVYRLLGHKTQSHEAFRQKLRGVSMPSKSVVLGSGSDLGSHEQYAGRLWERCWAEYPSTFGALYLWTTVWYIDIGNEGFHTTPLCPPPDQLWQDKVPSYMTAWRIRWRYLWHNSITCQLIIMLPTIISGLVALGPVA